jgi:hypothetical protein
VCSLARSAEILAYLYPKSVKKMAFHCVFNDYSGVEFNLSNCQKYTIKALGAILLLVKLSSLIMIKIYLRGGKTIFRGGGMPPLHPPKKNPDYGVVMQITNCVNVIHATVTQKQL